MAKDEKKKKEDTSTMSRKEKLAAKADIFKRSGGTPEPMALKTNLTTLTRLIEQGKGLEDILRDSRFRGVSREALVKFIADRSLTFKKIKGSAGTVGAWDKDKKK